jgi:hypothetical protein
VGFLRANGNSRLTLVPALDPEAPYYSRLSARSALYTDLRLLLGDRDHALSRDGYRALAIDENCLARSSTAARRKLWSELRSRYRLDANDPLFGAFWKEWRRCASDLEKSLTAYTLLALNDRLVASLGVCRQNLLDKLAIDLREGLAHLGCCCCS